MGFVNASPNTFVIMDYGRKKIQAIKLVHSHTKNGLVAAKNAVEKRNAFVVEDSKLDSFCRQACQMGVHAVCVSSMN